MGQTRSTTGDIQGTITDPARLAVANASVRLSNPDTGVIRSTTSDGAGAFLLPLLPPGRYRIAIEAAGFATRTVENVPVRIGDSVVLPVGLELGGVATEIEVSPDPTDPARTQQAATVTLGQIRQLPINRRNYLDLAILAPAVVETTSLVEDVSYRPSGSPHSGLSFGGGNGRGNGFYIDGGENYNNSGGVRLNLTQEMIEEFQINRNSYSAEFGNASGGIVNIVSKSGTNQWHGNAFGFLRHRSIQARNYFDGGKSPFTRVQAGGTLGGAIRKDKTFFFAGLERLDRQESTFIPLLQDRGVFSRLTASQQRMVDSLRASGNSAGAERLTQILTPAGNAALVRQFTVNSGVFPFGEDLTTFGMRFDQRFSARHDAFFRANTATGFLANSSYGALDAYNRGRSIETRDATAMIGDTLALSANWLLETRLMFNYNTLGIDPLDAHGPEVNVAGFGLFGRQIFLPYYGIERHYQATQNFSRAAGRHHVKFGYDFNPMRNSFVSATFLPGRFTFGGGVPLSTALTMADPGLQAAIPEPARAGLNDPLTALQAYHLGIPAAFQQGFGDPNYVNFIKRLHFYAQDTVQVKQGLTLSIGLRHENEFHNPIVPPDRDNIGPRLGFAYSPGSGLVLRGGYGLYYSQVTSNIAGTADPLSGRFINQIFLPQAGIAGINDARTGRTLTPADIYQTLLRQGVIGSRQVAERDLLQFGLRPAPGAPLSVIFGVDAGFENPWAHQASFEMEKAMGSYTVSAGYTFNRAAHIARILGRNVQYTGQRLADGRPTFSRIEPLVLQRNLFFSNANSFYHAATVQLNRRYSNGLSLNTHYTFSKAMDEVTDFNSDYSPNDQLNARAERALSPFHQRHRFVLSSVYERRHWMFAPIVSANSWRPFNVQTGVDLPSGGDGYA
ncbi:MAG: carboxypeptidase regulatory-like domain-containing protein, partial [Bryobacterales bacterium]|nr:carboxypeptidase regulatory-like domain-containing protein [Bryobacterales bacterium]